MNWSCSILMLAVLFRPKFPGVHGERVQFYETYSDPEFVSPLATQLNSISVLQKEFISSILTKVSWTNHLEILSQTKSPEEKFFYLLYCIKEKWSKRELRRQLSSGYFERTMLSKQKASTLLTQLPTELFRDPYIFGRIVSDESFYYA